MLAKNQVLLIAMSLVLVSSVFASGQAQEKHCSDYLYGLYYGSWDNKGSDLSFVISSDGKPIPQKSNDPDAPTLPGFYVGEKRYEFDSSKVSAKEMSFQTKQVDGTAFSFQGRFGCEPVDVIPEVPYFAGELKEMRNGRLIRKKSLHFGRAVVL